jgi:hypothetical protein
VWRDALVPNKTVKQPWADHVRPFAELPSAALHEAVGFDKHLWELAKTDAKEAAKESVLGRIHYRHGAPRVGEPIYRTPARAERNQPTMACGRGTGHLGTGLYFFGTLSAAFHSRGRFAPKLSRMDEATLREETQHVWVVDVSSLDPPLDVDFREWAKTHPTVRYLFGDKQVWKYHDFAKALLCYPSGLTYYRKIAAELAEATAALAVAKAAWWDAPSGDDDEAATAMWELEDTVKQLETKERSVGRNLERDLHRIDWDAPRWEQIDRPSYSDVEPLAPTAQAAVDAYVRDVEERRFPGYHPMTYYMRSIGVSAIIHRDWGQHNAGDVGNIWYPEVSP